MSAAAPPSTQACPNCGAAAPGAYCPSCGQSQRDRLRASLRDLAAEGIEELLSVDGRVAVTVHRLLRRPGFLTAEYLAGRRARYIRPLRLYLTCSVLFFVALSLSGSARVVDDGDGMVRAFGGAVTIRAQPGTATDVRPECAPDAPAAGDAIERRLRRWTCRPSAERLGLVVGAVERQMPTAVFALMPFFALLLRLVHRRSGFGYAEHLIFALHLHAAAFLVAAAYVLLPGPGAMLQPLLVVLLVAYLFLALRRVYGASRRRTALRLLAIAPPYLLALVLALGGVMFASMLAA